MEKSSLQSLNELSKFEGNTESRTQYVYQAEQNQPVAIPSANDAYYDPNHPDADWAGLVKRETAARQRVEGKNTHASGLQFAAGGVMSAEHVAESDPIGLNAKKKQLGAQMDQDGVVIGGIPQENPYQYWKSSYNSMTHHEETNPELYTDMHKSMQKGGKKTIIPQYEATNQMRSNSNSSFGNNTNSTQRRRTPPAGAGSRSLLAGIGEQLATSNTIQALPSDVNRSITMNRKELVQENFRDLPPGYTGVKKY